jgi:hypothetical protein
LRLEIGVGNGSLHAHTPARRQRLEHDEQGQADGVGQQRLMLGIDPVHPVDE